MIKDCNNCMCEKAKCSFVHEYIEIINITDALTRKFPIIWSSLNCPNWIENSNPEVE